MCEEILPLGILVTVWRFRLSGMSQLIRIFYENTNFMLQQGFNLASSYQVYDYYKFHKYVEMQLRLQLLGSEKFFNYLWLSYICI